LDFGEFQVELRKVFKTHSSFRPSTADNPVVGEAVTLPVNSHFKVDVDRHCDTFATDNRFISDIGHRQAQS
jgi:hypothetical protein